MNPFFALLVEVSLTILACILLTSYLRPFLQKVLIDLCRTEERAQFWTAFSNILLIGVPVLIALGFRPQALTMEESVFEILGRVSGSFVGYLLALIGVGIFVSIFALFAPRTTVEAK